MSYIGAEPGGQGSAERFVFTATSTSATVSHSDSGIPIGYTPNHVSVYLNGVKQVIPTDVAASNGSTVVFASNLVVDDVIEVIALSTFSAAKTEGTSIQSTGETGGTKFLREDGDNSSSWQTATVAGITTSANATAITIAADETVTHAEMGTFSKLLQNPDTISANITIASGFSAVAGGPVNFTGTVAVNGNLIIV